MECAINRGSIDIGFFGRLEAPVFEELATEIKELFEQFWSSASKVAS
jgi:hypothetical protein